MSQMATGALNHHHKSINGSQILLIGVAYKKNTDDIRESPALEIADQLQARGAEVSFHDPYIERFKTGSGELIASELDGILEAADLVIVVTDHDCIDWPSVLSRSGCLIDTRNVSRGYKSLPGKIWKL